MKTVPRLPPVARIPIYRSDLRRELFGPMYWSFQRNLC
jgi:hypothetical protein